MTTGRELAGKVALVTTAARGIGRAVALRLAKAGAAVVLTGRDQRALRATGAELGELGAHWMAAELDLTRPETLTNLVKVVRTGFGVPDVVVCNSGVSGPTAPVWEMDPAEWDRTLAVNTTGVFHTVRAFAPGMIERGSGSIVLIGTMEGQQPMPHRAAYATSKLGLLGFCRSAALDLAPHNVRVNLLSPGHVVGDRPDWPAHPESDRAKASLLSGLPLGRFVDSADVGNSVVFLASDASAAITGEEVNVTAGLVMF
ncbi:SDR family NAD(P)-dependent oxidoreductase [Amycolatopsis suaedae]|uniref:SDR family oxidoreductase n=1 Tax=Amycolatopsis suaedae TaxID=2510978 RepID=A0A4Q7JFW7_9PSEU|nr:SDR family NAD(P)-dependent oxidoreductase [Amycolatopsis suaedae]RZQ65564.1 SDR family oxidoreductase [Amycolatopsis suaedae]